MRTRIAERQPRRDPRDHADARARRERGGACGEQRAAGQARTIFEPRAVQHAQHGIRPAVAPRLRVLDEGLEQGHARRHSQRPLRRTRAERQPGAEPGQPHGDQRAAAHPAVPAASAPSCAPNAVALPNRQAGDPDHRLPGPGRGLRLRTSKPASQLVTNIASEAGPAATNAGAKHGRVPSLSGGQFPQNLRAKRAAAAGEPA